jgi:hypothetical protein
MERGNAVPGEVGEFLADVIAAEHGAAELCGAPDAIGVVSPVEVLVADEAQRRGTLDSGG